MKTYIFQVSTLPKCIFDKNNDDKALISPKKSLFWTSNQLFAIHFLLATCNVCSLVIPEFFEHNMGIWLLANHSLRILNSRTSKIPCLMRLLLHLLLSAQHVPGVNNQLANALSRFHWQDFHLLAPEAQPLLILTDFTKTKAEICLTNMTGPQTSVYILLSQDTHSLLIHE